ncbi:MAG: amidohydrolase [Bdellovibrio sp.]|nr:MAG: amidohydrolase [Bdellovibrio sp.]
MKIDIHTHILPPQIPRFKDRFGYGGFIELHHSPSCCSAQMVRDDGQFFRQVQSNCWNPIDRLQDCDKYQVHIQVLSTVPVMFSYWTKPQDGLYIAQFLNDHLASVIEEHPSRFWGLGTLPLQAPQLAIKELERCLEIGLKGVQIGSHVNGWNLGHPELFPFFEAAESLGAAIFVHPWDMMGKERMPEYWLPWLVGMPAETSLAICSMIFSGLFEKLPRLKVAFAHGGGAFPWTIGRISHGHRVRPDLCAIHNKKPPESYLGHFYVDSLVHDMKALQYLVDLVGSHRVALGSDYPFPLGEAHPGKLIEDCPHFSEKTKQQLLYKTALDWLSVPENELPF